MVQRLAELDDVASVDPDSARVAGTALGESNRSIQWIEGVISYLGRQDNLAIREAAFFALARSPRTSSARASARLANAT